MMTLRIAMVFAVFIGLGSGAGCSNLGSMRDNEHVVDAPLSDRVNAVLRTMIAECGATSGDWDRSISPGCGAIFATQFGLRAGLRRQRADLIELGRRSADAAARGVDRVAFARLSGDQLIDEEEAHGFAALLVSGALDGNSSHLWKFQMVLDEVMARLGDMKLNDEETAVLGVLLAEAHRLNPDADPRYLNAARQLAGQIPQPSFEATARVALARATGDPEDLRAARIIAHGAAPRFDASTRTFTFSEDEPHILSHHLSLIGALADVAQLARDREAHAKALALLDFVFSEKMLQNGRLTHDRGGGRASEDYCSGCNFHALYLADRLYGDTLRIDAVPPLPDRNPTIAVTRRRVILPLRSGQEGTVFDLDAGLTLHARPVYAPADAPNARARVIMWYRITHAWKGETYKFVRWGDTPGVAIEVDEQGRGMVVLNTIADPGSREAKTKLRHALHIERIRTSTSETGEVDRIIEVRLHVTAER